MQYLLHYCIKFHKNLLAPNSYLAALVACAPRRLRYTCDRIH
jgi:hypothetical protein